jgi:hypothetical protein
MWLVHEFSLKASQKFYYYDIRNHGFGFCFSVDVRLTVVYRRVFQDNSAPFSNAAASDVAFILSCGK